MSSSAGKRHHQSTSNLDPREVGSQDETDDRMNGSDLSQGMIDKEEEQKFILSPKNQQKRVLRRDIVNITRVERTTRSTTRF